MALLSAIVRAAEPRFDAPFWCTLLTGTPPEEFRSLQRLGGMDAPNKELELEGAKWHRNFLLVSHANLKGIIALQQEHKARFSGVRISRSSEEPALRKGNPLDPLLAR